MQEKVKTVILSLQRGDRDDIIKANQELFPDIHVIKSVNGYDAVETRKELAELNISFYKLDEGFETYGTLANWITKVKMLKQQVVEGYPYMIMLEDDILLGKHFMEIVMKLLKLGPKLNRFNIIRLGPWGEGYISTLSGAKRCLTLLQKKGIVYNIDNQLRVLTGPELHFDMSKHFETTVEPNYGDCLKTLPVESFYHFTTLMSTEHPNSKSSKCSNCIRYSMSQLIKK